ncbi:MAG: fatty acid desaturase family protein [Candidatus Dormibacter sp.]|uniref:fatty acid desaturase family protein n=1 Tax=Candidatus Dormibacter sp. TaxID=2973982 RepID=UPI003D9B3C2F
MTAALMPTSSAATDASDYAVLKRRIQEAGLLDKQPAFYLRSIAFKLIGLSLCIALFVLYHPLWLVALNSLVVAFIFGQLGFQLHDSGHRQMFERSRLNVLVGLLTANLGLGMSYGWWVDKHNRHHANPNSEDLDPDIGPGVIAYSEEQAWNSKGVGRFIAKYQAFFFFPLLFLLGFSMHYRSVQFLVKRRSKYRVLELVLLASFWLLYVGFFVLVLGPLPALLAILIQQCCGGCYMALVFAPNHKGMPQIEAGTNVSFLVRQVITSRNVKPHPLTDVWYGALNYQIEHHLFPTLPRNQMAKAHDIVREFCEEHGIPYYETSLVQSYREILGFLHEVGAPLRNGQRTPLAVKL